MRIVTALIAACAPCALLFACLGEDVSPQPRELDIIPVRAIISGAPPQAVQQVEWGMVNKGRLPLFIGQVRPACLAVRAAMDHDVLLPGQHGRLTALVPTTRCGPEQGSIKVLDNEERELGQAHYMINVDVQMGLSLCPRKIVVARDRGPHHHDVELVFRGKECAGPGPVEWDLPLHVNVTLGQCWSWSAPGEWNAVARVHIGSAAS